MAAVSRWLTALVLMLAPIPFGSVELQWVAVWAFLLSIALALAPTRSLGREDALRLGLPVLVILAGLLLVWLQTSAPPILGAPAPGWSEARAVLALPEHAPVAAALGKPWAALGPLLTALLALLCGYLNSTDVRGAKVILLAVAGSTALSAAYAIIAQLADPTNVLGDAKVDYLDSLTGTFINRNTAATYYGVGAIVWLLLLVQQALPRLNLFGRISGSGRSLLGETSSPRLWLAVASLCVVGAALLMTISRAGIILSCAACILAVVLYTRPDARTRTGLVAGIAVIMLAPALLELLGGRVAIRIGTQGLVDADRWTTYRTTFRMIADAPWLGTGWGTFAEVYPSYRPDTMSTYATWDRAHSALLELAS